MHGASCRPGHSNTGVCGVLPAPILFVFSWKLVGKRIQRRKIKGNILEGQGPMRRDSEPDFLGRRYADLQTISLHGRGDSYLALPSPLPSRQTLLKF